MTNSRFDKIVNLDLARGALRNAEPHGEFKAFVRLAQPEAPPSYMKHLKLHSPGLFKGYIPCDQIENAADDRNVLSIELREHISCHSAH